MTSRCQEESPQVKGGYREFENLVERINPENWSQVFEELWQEFAHSVSADLQHQKEDLSMFQIYTVIYQHCALLKEALWRVRSNLNTDQIGEALEKVGKLNALSAGLANGPLTNRATPFTSLNASQANYIIDALRATCEPHVDNDKSFRLLQIATYLDLRTRNAPNPVENQKRSLLGRVRDILT